jgi:PAS domain S-box-containing protein
MKNTPSYSALSLHRFRSILFLLVLVVLSEYVNRSIMHMPLYGTFFLLPVVYATFTGGVGIGLLSVGLVFLYFLYAFADPNRLFYYSSDMLLTLCSVTVGAIVMVLMMGRLQLQVKALLRRNESILNSIEEGIIGLNSAEEITFVNPAALHMLARREEELIGTPIAIVTTAFQKEQIQFGSSHQHLRHQESATHFMRKDGSRFPVEYVSSPIHLKGQQVGTVISFRDISKRQQLEAQFVQAQKMEAIGRMAGGVAHDFNNLLTVMNGYIDLLLEETNKHDPRYKDISEVKSIVKRASHLTRQLLTFSHKQDLATELIDLNELIGQMDTLLTRLVGEKVDLQIELAPELGKIRNEQSQIEQVIMNLVINARDATAQGGQIRIETSPCHFQEPSLTMAPGDYILLVVSDTGIGIDAHTREQIFEPFFTTKAEGEGTGLGLATVYSIVTQSGGKIEVSSQVGHGSSFRIYLPQAEEQTTEQLAPEFNFQLEDAIRPLFFPKTSNSVAILEDSEVHDQEVIVLRD